jgi:hypothetical protein
MNTKLPADSHQCPAVLKYLAAFALLSLSSISISVAETPPVNPWAANSPWPQFHRNGFAQASTPEAGPELNARIEVQTINFPGTGTPTQMHLSERYPDGSRTAWSTTLNSIVKARVRGNQFEAVDSLRISRSKMPVSYWNMQLARGNKAFVPDPQNRAILRFGDSNPRDPMSKIRLETRWDLPKNIPGKPIVINLSYDGWVVFFTTEGWIGSVRQDFSDARYFNLSDAIKDKTIHNSFPLDENGVAYFVSFNALTAVRWTGNNFQLMWRAPYDFRGPDCGPPSSSPLRELLRVFRGEGCTGSGTTPTLFGSHHDKLVAVVDGHVENSIVFFWRDRIPNDWRGLPGQDRRVAAIVHLPFATSRDDGFTTENSPAADGASLVVTQFAGFAPKCDSPMGVQKVSWNPQTRTAQIDWARNDVQFNGIPTISTSSSTVYGVGRAGNGSCNYIYRGLDFATGRTRGEVILGPDRKFLDQGNSHVINDDQSIIYGSPTGMVRIRPVTR